MSAGKDAALIVIGPPKWSPEPNNLDNPVPPEDDAVLLRLSEDGRATAYSGKVEYGQGIRSGFAYAVADELDLPVDSVEVVLGDTRRVPYDRGTTGSASTRTVGLQLRRAAAAARQTLIGLAAEEWGTDAGGLQVREGEVLEIMPEGHVGGPYRNRGIRRWGRQDLFGLMGETRADDGSGDEALEEDSQGGRRGRALHHWQSS